MGPVTEHLHAIIPSLPRPFVNRQRHWAYTKKLNSLPIGFYEEMLWLHPTLNLEYSILCNELRYDFQQWSNPPSAHAKEKLIAALMLCELLLHISKRHLNVPREVVRLHGHQQIFRALLKEHGYHFNPKEERCADIQIPSLHTARMRELSGQINLYRLIVTRSNRCINILNTVITQNQIFNMIMQNASVFTMPLFAYLGWAQHFPRLVLNTFLALKHIIPGGWMSEYERSLSLGARFKGQVQRRWFEFGNDLVWFVAGVLGCFVFVGASAPVAAYISVAAFAFDIVYASVRAFMELSRLYKLRGEYQLQQQKTSDEEGRQAISSHIEAIQRRIDFEILRHSIITLNTIAVFAGMLVALPVFALSPAALLASAVFIVAVWGVTFYALHKMEEYRPNDTLIPPSPTKEPVKKSTPASQIGLFAVKKDTSPNLLLGEESAPTPPQMT